MQLASVTSLDVSGLTESQIAQIRREINNLVAENAQAKADKELMDCMDFAFVENRFRSELMVPVVPLYTYGKTPPQYLTIHFPHIPKDHPMHPIAMRGSLRAMEIKRDPQGHLQLGEEIFARWARRAKLTALSHDEFDEKAGDIITAAYKKKWSAFRLKNLGVCFLGRDYNSVYVNGQQAIVSDKELIQLRAMHSITKRLETLDAKISKSHLNGVEA
jgi:hypothetical protein